MVMFLKGKIRSAIDSGDLKRLGELIDGGAAITIDLESGKDMLYYAVQKARTEVVDFLLQKGANPNTRNDSRWTSLHRAAYDGQLELVAKLLKAGADPNLRTSDGRTPQSMAVNGGYIEMAEMLKPFMKKASELFELPPVPAQPDVPAFAPADGWELMSPAQVAHTAVGAKAGYKVTDVFNFASRERIRIINNLDTKRDQVETKTFDELAGTGVLEDAFKALTRLGGKADAQSIGGGLQKATRLPPPQGN